MNKQEALEQIEQQKEAILQMQSWAFYGYIEGLVKQLDEPQKIELPKMEFEKSRKVTVPQFVADWYEEHKEDLDYSIWNVIYSKATYNVEDKKIEEWIESTEDAIITLVKMHLFGYTIKDDKKYLVKMKGVTNQTRTLKRNIDIETWYFGNPNNYEDVNAHHTHKELEQAGFGWVFDCEGIEIEEVEE